jgi:acetyl-CoA C-acetyltransferase
MARRILGLSEDFCPTVAGGLTFHGAPFNNYMSHGAAAMTRRLREAGGVGLLYGQGEFVTKHHALILSAAPGADDGPLVRYSVQEAADRRRGQVPPIMASATGRARVESHTILYDPKGEPEHGVVIARLDDGGRAIAKVDRDDVAGLAVLADPDRTAIGLPGDIWQSGQILRFAFR